VNLGLGGCFLFSSFQFLISSFPLPFPRMQPDKTVQLHVSYISVARVSHSRMRFPQQVGQPPFDIRILFANDLLS
jgi:hypothetical protein